MQLLNPIHKESLEMIVTKMSRITNGNSREVDHWLDIAGYALIAAEACNQKETEDET